MRWSFSPNSTCGGKELITIGNMHSTLESRKLQVFRIFSPKSRIPSEFMGNSLFFNISRTCFRKENNYLFIVQYCLLIFNLTISELTWKKNFEQSATKDPSETLIDTKIIQNEFFFKTSKFKSKKILRRSRKMYDRKQINCSI